VELCLGLCDKPSFAWSSLGNPSTWYLLLA
jgi:hypothetical protein